MSAGTAATRPAAVLTRASAMPGATVTMEVEPVTPIWRKALEDSPDRPEEADERRRRRGRGEEREASGEPVRLDAGRPLERPLDGGEALDEEPSRVGRRDVPPRLHLLRPARRTRPGRGRRAGSLGYWSQTPRTSANLRLFRKWATNRSEWESAREKLQSFPRMIAHDPREKRARITRTDLGRPSRREEQLNDVGVAGFRHSSPAPRGA